MSTLIASGSSGKARRACNAKCYDAKGPDCDCMCGGINHGVGEMQARQNCGAMGVAWIERTKRLPCFKRRQPFVPEQGDLFAALRDVNEGLASGDLAEQSAAQFAHSLPKVI
jgi:hypothetical protein